MSHTTQEGRVERLLRDALAYIRELETQLEIPDQHKLTDELRSAIDAYAEGKSHAEGQPSQENT